LATGRGDGQAPHSAVRLSMNDGWRRWPVPI
jgi:hypothetical protein